MTKIISIANQKGGVAKTTTALNLAAGLVRKGKKVLVLDLDPQANLTYYLGYEPDDLPTIAELLQQAASGSISQEIIECCIRTNAEGIDYIPSNIFLSSADLFLSHVIAREQVLGRITNSPAMSGYDFILIDCLPSLGLLLTMALTASHELIIPVQPHRFAAEGLTYLDQIYQIVKTSTNPKLEISGVLLTMAERTNMAKVITAEIQEEYGDKVFKTSIRKLKEAGESANNQASLISMRDSRLGEEYMQVVKELLERQVR